MTEMIARESLLKYAKSKQNGVFPIAVNRKDSILNPVCGDHVEMQLALEEGRIVQFGFAAKACAICTASAAVLSENVKGWSLDQAQSLRQQFEIAITAPAAAPWPTQLAAFEIFSHLRVNPSRRGCAALPWLLLTKILQSAN